MKYVYTVNGASQPSTMETETLTDSGTYLMDFIIEDGFGQLRQEQATTRDGQHNTLVTGRFYDSHGWTVKTAGPYPVAGVPNTAIVQTADASVPNETSVSFDGRGRELSSAFYAYASLQWQNSIAYPGIDRTDITPPQGGTATSTFVDALGRTSAIWNYTTPTPDGNSADARVIGYTYTPAGQPATITGPGGQQWTYHYDLHGHRTNASDPDTGTTATAYDTVGDLLSSTDANGQLISYTYDKLGRKTNEYAGTSSTGTLLAAWTYDTVAGGKGQPATATSYIGGSGGIAYNEAITGYSNKYTPTGESLTIPANVPANEQALVGTYTTSTAYNAISGLPSSTTYGAYGGLPAETVGFSYSVEGVLANFGGLTGYLTGTQADPFGRIDMWFLGAMPDQVVQTNQYDASTGHLTGEFLDKETGSGHVDAITPLYNAAGKITATEERPGRPHRSAVLQLRPTRPAHAGLDGHCR